jgi:RNA polymerase sigma-70 factor (ECF subfamily)
MGKHPRSDGDAAAGLEEISTRWRLITDPVQFVMRYAPAIQKYLEALLKNSHDAEEIAQEFLLKGLLRGFVRTTELRGRFRYYLKAAVRNAALAHLQRRRPERFPVSDPANFPDPHDLHSQAEQDWAEEWRRCVIDRTLQALEHHQQQMPGNLFYTAMRLSLDHPEEDSTALAQRMSALIGRPIQAVAFRKQLSRARRRFAELLVAEVALTLEEPTAERVEEELTDVGLLSWVQGFLPPDWKSHLPLPPAAN